MENNSETATKKVFTTVDKSLLLNAGRTIARTFWLPKAKYTEERDKIVNKFEETLNQEIEKMIAEYREKGAKKLEKRLEKLNSKIAEIDKKSAAWEAIIMRDTGHRSEDIFDFEVTTSETGIKSVKATFKYPDVLPPADTVEPECPTHEFGSDFDEDKEVLAADDEREADVDEDMPGEFTELPTPEVPVDELPFDEEPAVTEEGDVWDDEAVATQTSPTEEPDEEEIADMEQQLNEEPATVAEEETAAVVEQEDDDENPFEI